MSGAVEWPVTPADDTYMTNAWTTAAIAVAASEQLGLPYRWPPARTITAKESAEYQRMLRALRADLRRMTRLSKTSIQPGVNVPLWSFRLIGKLRVTGKDLRIAEEVSTLSLAVLMDSNKQSIMDLSKSLRDSLTSTEPPITSINQLMSIDCVTGVTLFGTIGMMRHTIPYHSPECSMPLGLL